MMGVKLEADKIYEAIADGVCSAIWRMISEKSRNPCEDFYIVIRDAAQEAFERIAIEKDRGKRR